jgi:hypothetical protein
VRFLLALALLAGPLCASAEALVNDYPITGNAQCPAVTKCQI